MRLFYCTMVWYPVETGKNFYTALKCQSVLAFEPAQEYYDANKFATHCAGVWDNISISNLKMIISLTATTNKLSTVVLYILSNPQIFMHWLFLFK